MSWLASLLAAIPKIIDFIGMVVGWFKKSPSEKREAKLSKVRNAITHSKGTKVTKKKKARKKGDTSKEEELFK